MTSPYCADDLRAALSRLALTCADYAALIAACRASIAAAARGDDDPLGYVRGLLAQRGQLPAPGASPLLVLADARAALHMAGWPATRADGHVTGSAAPPERPAWPRADDRPVLEIAPAVTRPGADDPTPPCGDPCGCLDLPGPGTYGILGALRHSPCNAHRGAWSCGNPGHGRVALYEITLDGEPSSARAGRQWAGRILDGCPAADSTVQALSELVANSAVHSLSAGQPASVRVRLIIAPGGWIRAEVRDDGPAEAAPAASIIPDDSRPLHGDAIAESGRGLGIVAALADDAGRDDGMAWLVMRWQPGAAPRQRGLHGATAVKESA